MREDEDKYTDIWVDMWLIPEIMDSIINETNRWENCRKLPLSRDNRSRSRETIGDLIYDLERRKKRILNTVMRVEYKPREEGIYGEVHVDFSEWMPRECYHQRFIRLVHFLQSEYYCCTIVAHVKNHADAQFKIVEMNIGQFYHSVMRSGNSRREELIQIPGMIEWIIEE